MKTIVSKTREASSFCLYPSMPVALGCLLIGLMVYVFTNCSSSSSSSTSSFGTNGKVLSAAGTADVKGYAMAIQADGMILVAGPKNTDEESSFFLARYRADGTLDSSFGSGGTVSTNIGGVQDSPNAILLQPDGKIILAGSALIDSDQRFALARYTSSGALDTSFGANGIVITPGASGVAEIANAAALQPDGKIVLAGSSSDGASSFALARYLASGALDPAFGTGGKVTTSIAASSVEDVAYGVALQTDGKIIAAGRSFDGKYKFALARYHSDGRLDTAFGANGIVATGAGSDSSGAYALATDGSGAIFAAGYANSGERDVFALAKYTAAGVLDTTFGTGGLAFSDFQGSGAAAYALRLKANGGILLAGYNDNYEADSETPTALDYALAGYAADGSPDTSLGRGGQVAIAVGDNVAFATAIGIQPAGNCILGGSATEGAQNKIALVRY